MKNISAKEIRKEAQNKYNEGDDYMDVLYKAIKDVLGLSSAYKDKNISIVASEVRKLKIS